ncbi:MAG: DNRLRE domain-containing protein, partial [bacterium]
MNPIIRYLLIFFFVIISVKFGFAQTDTEFWFAAPEITQGHGDRPVSLVITTLENASSVTISLPANPAFSPISFNIPDNSVNRYDLTPYIDEIENKIADSVLNRGVLVSTSTPVSAYYEIAGTNNYDDPGQDNEETNTDILALKGRYGLGTEFHIIQQNKWESQNAKAYTPNAVRSFEIVATEDNTTITINPTEDVIGHTAGTPFNVVLDKGQSFSVQIPAMDDGVYKSLAGSVVTSDKDIAITIASDSQYAQGYDLLADQTIPIDRIGKEYIAIKGQSNTDKECVFVMAVENTTYVEFNGTDGVTIDAGVPTYYCFDATSEGYLYIEADKDVYVYQTSGVIELGAAVLPPLDECTGSNEVGFTRNHVYYRDAANKDTEKMWMNIILQDPADPSEIPEDNFSFNVNGIEVPGVIQATDFEPVNTTFSGTWLAARIEIDTNDVKVGDAVRVTNDSAVFHLGYLHGHDYSSRFGYLAGFNDFDVDVMVEGIPGDTAGICVGQDYQLVATGGTRYEWTGTLTALSFLSDVNISNPIINVPAGNEGSYQYIVDIYNPCQVTPKKDTLVVIAGPKPAAPGGDDVLVCLGEPVPDLSATSTETSPYFHWYSDSLLLNLQQSSASNTYATGHTQKGTYSYWVTQTISGAATCESDSHKITLTIRPDSLAHLTITDPAPACPSVDLTDLSIIDGSSGGISETISFQDGVFPDLTYNGTKDVSIAGGFEENNNKEGEALFVTDRHSTLIKWDLSQIPANSKITSAEISFYTKTVSSYSPPIYEITKDWVIDEVTYNEYKSDFSWETAGATGAGDHGSTVLGTINTVNNNTMESHTLNTDGLQVIQDWVNGVSANNGFIIQDYSISSFSAGPQFEHEGATTADQHPKLTVSYVHYPLSYWEDTSATTELIRPDSVTTSGTYYIKLGNEPCADIEPVNVVINCCPDSLITGATITDVECY